MDYPVEKIKIYLIVEQEDKSTINNAQNICKEFKYNFSSSDLFSAFENKILITDRFCSSYKDDLLVELCLDNIEYRSIGIKKGLNLIAPDDFIPVSRIKNIIFKTIDLVVKE